MKRIAGLILALLASNVLMHNLGFVEGQTLPLAGIGRSGGSGGGASPSGSNGDVQVKSGSGFGAFGGSTCSVAGTFASIVGTNGAFTCATPAGSAVSTAGVDGNLQVKSGATLAAYGGGSCSIPGQMATVTSASGVFTCATPTTVNTVFNAADGTMLIRSGTYSVTGFGGAACSINGQVATVVGINGALTCATPTTLNTVANAANGTLIVRSGTYSVTGFGGTSCSINGQFASAVGVNGGLTCATPSASGSGTVSAGTTNRLAKYTASTTVGDSAATDDGTTLTYTGTGGLVASQVTTNGTGASITTANVTGVSTPPSGQTALYSDSTKKLFCSINDAGAITCLSGRRGLSFDIGVPGGTALTTAYTSLAYLRVPFACTLSAYNLAIDSGTITVKFSRVAAGGISTPTLSNAINTSGVSIATFSTATHSTSMSDFTSTAISADDLLGMHITAVSTAAYVNAVLQCDM